jgi:hypothetical protein
MRDVRYTNRFQRDYRREKSGRHGKKLDFLGMITATAISGRISY